jgi:MFS family permease
LTNAGDSSGLPLPGWTRALLAFSQTIIAVDYNIVYVALPSTGRALHFSEQNLQWVVSAYALLFGGCLLLGGRTADLLGRRRMFVAALWLYAASSTLGGFAANQGMLLASRAAQGLAAAFLFPATLSLITTLFTEGRERNRALVAWASAGASGSAVGVLLGGLLTSALGWRWTFFINVPFAIVAALMARKLIPRDAPSATPTRDRLREFDVVGAVLATSGALLLVYTLVEASARGWTSIVTITTLTGAVGVLSAFVVAESRVRRPLMPLRLFTNRSLTVAAAVTALFAASFGAQLYLLTIWLQKVHGFGPAEAGLAFLPYSFSIVVGTRIGARLIAGLGVRIELIIGLLTGATGLLLLAVLLPVAGGHAGYLIPAMITSGIGQGITWTGMWIMASAGLRREDAGVASGIASTSQQVGVAIGLAVLVDITNHGASGNRPPALPDGLASGLQSAFYAAAGIALLAAALVAVFPVRRDLSRARITPMSLCDRGIGPAP